MKRLGKFNNKVIIEQNNEPENENVIWKDPAADEFKEYEDGSWVKSRKIGSPNAGGGNEPLVVEGQFNIEFNFYPDAGQPDFSDAYTAFLDGTPVIMVGANDDMEPLRIQVIGTKEGGESFMYGIEPDSKAIAKWIA